MAGSRRVLIIDDNIINAELANAHLRRNGWTTRVVENGPDGLAALVEEPFDLVLLDISMPGMSGVEVCRAIRVHLRNPRPCVVAYTAHAMNEERQALIDEGFDEVLTKPIDRRAINGMLERMGFAERGTLSART